MWCRFIKSLALFLIDSDKGCRLVERHLRSCSECRRSMARQSRLSDALKREPLARPRLAPLHARIMRSIEPHTAVRQPSRPGIRMVPLFWQTAGAVALVAALLLLRPERVETESPSLHVMPPSLSLPADPLPAITRANAQMVDPLELELVYLQQDLKRAVELFSIPLAF
jgi:hypothetical protein